PGRVAPLGAEWPRPPGRHRGQLLPGRRGVQLARPRRPGPPGPPDGGFGGRHRGQLLVGPGVLRGLGAPRGRLGGEGGRPAPRRPPRALQGPDGGDGGLRPQLPPGAGDHRGLRVPGRHRRVGGRVGAGRRRQSRLPLLRRNRRPRLDAVGELRRLRRHGRLRRDLHLRRRPLRRARDGRHQRRLLCSPSVAPGFDARRSGAPQLGVVDAAGGARYDTLWRSALAAGADVVSVTSWNEWHEGTQIEPATPYCFPSDGYCSPGYEGVYGRTGTAAQTAYIGRTAQWAGDFAALRANAA